MWVRDVRNDYEIIGGVKFMAPSPGWGHVNVTANLVKIIGNHASVNKLGVVAADNFDVHFPDGSLFKPDFIFVSAAKAKSLFANKNATLHGVPDMVAEIFSRSTMKRDLGIKKDIYEKNGVREYWIIDPWRESIDVYLLRDGRYELGGHYENWSENDLEEREQLPEEERPEVTMEIPVAVLDGFKVKIRNIFGWYFE
ncbi:MAG: Uma2 family endonuclease [Quinella sp. 3Q1]|nr:Uma2 family endonuclease [Quinella sp. 3Q1]MBR6888961.1 Uma2 family endonuclease [Selenomonadaceae bacterium]